MTKNRPLTQDEFQQVQDVLSDFIAGLKQFQEPDQDELMQSKLQQTIKQAQEAKDTLWKAHQDYAPF